MPFTLSPYDIDVLRSDCQTLSFTTLAPAFKLHQIAVLWYMCQPASVSQPARYINLDDASLNIATAISHIDCIHCPPL